jgi:hypothetical protein
MASYLIQMLLPLVRANNERIEDSLFAKTRRELIEAFGGITAYTRAPAQGAWTSPEGQVERDDVVMVEVVTEAFDREWWRSFASTLATRFGQESIHVRAIAFETP